MKLEIKPEFDNYEQKLDKALNHFRNELSVIRAGRANPQILNKIVVDYYGTPTPIAQMANISVPEPRTLLVSLWDASALKDVSKAIMSADIGVNPSDDGKNIRLVFPQLNEERRKELIKQVKKMCEDCKVVLRNERRDMMETVKKLKKDNVITEDDEKQCGVDVQKLLDKRIELADKAAKDKEAEIIEV